MTTASNPFNIFWFCVLGSYLICWIVWKTRYFNTSRTRIHRIGSRAVIRQHRRERQAATAFAIASYPSDSDSESDSSSDGDNESDTTTIESENQVWLPAHFQLPLVASFTAEHLLLPVAQVISVKPLSATQSIRTFIAIPTAITTTAVYYQVYPLPQRLCWNCALVSNHIYMYHLAAGSYPGSLISRAMTNATSHGSSHHTLDPSWVAFWIFFAGK